MILDGEGAAIGRRTALLRHPLSFPHVHVLSVRPLSQQRRERVGIEHLPVEKRRRQIVKERPLLPKKRFRPGPCLVDQGSHLLVDGLSRGVGVRVAEKRRVLVSGPVVAGGPRRSLMP